MKIKRRKVPRDCLRELRSYEPQAKKSSANVALAIKKGSNKMLRNYIIGFTKKPKQRKKII